MFHLIFDDCSDCFNFQMAFDGSVKIIFLLFLKDRLRLLRILKIKCCFTTSNAAVTLYYTKAP